MVHETVVNARCIRTALDYSPFRMTFSSAPFNPLRNLYALFGPVWTCLDLFGCFAQQSKTPPLLAANNRFEKTLPCHTMQLVAVKADEWQDRTSKVMNQPRPQLEVVRELYNEGRNLGFEKVGETYTYLFSFCACTF